jgi:hypothetical protein
MGSMEDASIVFRPDGTGFTYWTRAGGPFSVNRFSWQTPASGQLDPRLHKSLSGWWDLRGSEIRHQVDRQSVVHSELTLSFAIVAGQDVLGRPATLLEFDRRVIQGTLGARFAFCHRDAYLDDPTVTGALPAGWPDEVHP